jgi:hypothetical protein
MGARSGTWTIARNNPAGVRDCRPPWPAAVAADGPSARYSQASHHMVESLLFCCESKTHHQSLLTCSDTCYSAASVPSTHTPHPRAHLRQAHPCRSFVAIQGSPSLHVQIHCLSIFPGLETKRRRPVRQVFRFRTSKLKPPSPDNSSMHRIRMTSLHAQKVLAKHPQTLND